MRAPTVSLFPRTVADLLIDLGDISPDRIRLEPPPGRATEEDLIYYAGKKDALYELVDETLVLKGLGWIGWSESSITSWLMGQLFDFLKTSDVGEFVGPA